MRLSSFIRITLLIEDMESMYDYQTSLKYGCILIVIPLFYWTLHNLMAPEHSHLNNLLNSHPSLLLDSTESNGFEHSHLVIVYRQSPSYLIHRSGQKHDSAKRWILVRKRLDTDL